MINRSGRIVYIAVFLLMMLVPLFKINTDTEVLSDIDSRYLKELPNIGDADMATDIEQYIRDRIGFRSQMNTCYQILMDKVTSNLEHPLYTYGKDGYVFFKMHNNVEFEEYHRIFCDAVIKMKDYCETRGAKFYFIFDPEKSSVYRRYLPAGVNYDDEWTDKLINTLETSGVICVNNKDLLIKYSQSEQVFNRKYDAGHWNDRGCFHATNNLWKAMKGDFSAITEYSEDDFSIETEKEKYLPASTFPIDENVETYSFNGKWEVITNQYPDLKTDLNHSFFQYYKNESKKASEYPKMLVFQGSYYNRKPEFLIGRTRECISIHNYQNVLNLDYYFNIFQPDAVVFEVAEYVFSDYYFDSARMASLNMNPSLYETGITKDRNAEWAIASAKEVKYDRSVNLNLSSGKGMDTVFLDHDIPSAKYVYLIADNVVFDIEKNRDGLYLTGVPHKSIDQGVKLYYTDHNGESFWTDLNIKEANYFTGEDLSYSENSRYLKNSRLCVFKTDISGNRFSGVAVQLINGSDGTFIDNIATGYEKGNVSAVYTHDMDSGWYTIRLKANSNMSDEYGDSDIYLDRGDKYWISFDIRKLRKKEVEIRDFEFIGTKQ